MVMNDKLTLPLTHYHYDIFEAYYEKWDERFKVRFGIDLRGEIDSITMQVESAIKDITFARRADAMLRDPAILKQFVGVYNYEGFPHTVSFKDAVTLKLSIPGDMDRLLLPYRGTEFNVEGLSGCSVLFKQEEGATEGHYNQAVFTIPGAVFTAQRVE